MIRVNLIPHKREAKRAGGAEGNQIWLLFIGAALVVELIVLFFAYRAEQDDLTVATKRNSETEARVNDIKRMTADHDSIKSQLAELKEREDAIQKLQSARTGPTSILLEVSHILTPHVGPTVDRDKLEQLKRDSPGAVPNANWDPRRLALTSYMETDRKVHLRGMARDAEDVSEFLRRLTLSNYFYDVRLLPAGKFFDAATKVELVQFELSAKARY